MARRRLLLEAIALAAVLAFVAGVTYIPHADAEAHAPPQGLAIYRLGVLYSKIARGQPDYPYTVHVDENVHWVAMASTERAASLRYEGLFFSTPGTALPLSLRGLVHERGFHTSIVAFQELTGVPFEDVFRFLPALWLPVSAALVWAALRPWPGALPAAGLVALVPTTARFLGPGFLVPIGFGLAWLAVAVLLLQEVMRQGRAAGLLLVFLVGSFFIHLILGFAVLLLVLCALPFARGNRRGAALLALLSAIPILALGPIFLEDIQTEVQVAEFLPRDFTIFDQIGIPVLIFWAAGCAVVALRPPQQAPLPVLAATTASVVMLGFIVLGTATHLHLYALYDRWHQPFMLLATVPVAAGIVAFAEEAAAAGGRIVAWLPRLRRALARAPSWGRPAFAVCVGGLMWVGVTDPGLEFHLRTSYYHVLEDRDWAAFTWAAANVNGSYDVFLAHPWKAPIFTALTGKMPLTYLAPGAPPIKGAEYDAYVAGKYSDAPWLVERDVSVVIDTVRPAPPFEPAGPDTSELQWAYAQELHALRST